MISMNVPILNENCSLQQKISKMTKTAIMS